MSHAGPWVGATMASSRCLLIVASMPSLRDRRMHASRAFRYAGVVSGPFFSASMNSSCPKSGISASAWAWFHSMSAFIVRGPVPPSLDRYASRSALNS